MISKTIPSNIPDSRHIQNRRRVCDGIPYWAGYPESDLFRPICRNTQIIHGTIIISILHYLSKETDGASAAVRPVFLLQEGL